MASNWEWTMEFWGFWLIAIAAMFVVFSVFLRAMFSARTETGSGKELAVYIDQLGEVERDLKRGNIGSHEAERLRIEVSRRLLKADGALGSQGTSTTLYLPLVAAIIAFVLGSSIYLYQYLGAPGYADLPLAKRITLAKDAHDNRPLQATAEAQAPSPEPIKIDPEFAQLLDRLRAALRANPDDLTGLALLARNEARVGNFAKAKEAYLHLIALQDGDAPVEQHLDLAQTMIAAAGGYVSPEAEAQLIKVLARDPQNGLARYFSGLLAAQTGRPDIGFTLWESLVRQGPQDAPWIAPILLGLPELAERAGAKYQPPSDTKGPSAQDVEAAAGLSDKDRQTMIASMVRQLEARLFAKGGPVDEWSKLISSLGVLGEPARAKTAYLAAVAEFSDDAPAKEALLRAATEAGVLE